METIKERPIIFNTEMVKAILGGRKTQTRRVIKPQPDYSILKKDVELEAHKCPVLGPMHLGRKEWGLYGKLYKPTAVPCFAYDCPYGKIGDRLWVRETWFSFPTYDNLKPSAIPHTESIESMHENDIDYLVSPIPYYNRGKKRPSIFMPRWASRIDLEIIDIRVERVQDIPVKDAVLEGISDDYIMKKHPPSKAFRKPTAREAFRVLWDSINAKRGYGWKSNPWVWVIVFKVLRKEGAGE